MRTVFPTGSPMTVVNVSQVITLDKRQLGDRVGPVDHETLAQVESGIRPCLDLAT